MATASGDIYGEYVKQSRLRLHWEYTQDIPNNCDHFVVTVYAQKPSGTGTHSYGYHDSIYYITGFADNKLINGTGDWSWGNVTEYYIGSSSFDNVHNPDGTSGNVSIGAAWITGLSSSSVIGYRMEVSGTVTNIPTIPRYATANQSLSSKTSSSIKMNWSSDSTIDYIWYSKDGGSTWTAVGSVNASSGNYTISGLTSNTTYSIKTRVRRKDSQLTTDSSALSVKTYAKTTPTIALSSKTVNSITVSSNCNVTTSETKYRIKTASGSYGSYQTSNVFTGLSPNTSYVIEVYKVGQESGESGTATLSVTTYQKALISSAPNFNLGSDETVTYSNPSGNTIAVGLYNSNGSTAIRSYTTASGTSYKFTFTDSELDTLYKMFGNNNSIAARIYLRTTNNGTNYIDYKDITITLTGNQKTGHVNVNGAWKRGKMWTNVNGTWKRCVLWTNVNGIWKRCI